MLAKNLTFQEIKKHSAKLAIIATGSLEQHGPYLPLATDAIVAEEVAKALEQQMPEETILFPTIYYGCSKEHKKFPGTVYVEYTTYHNFLKEVFASIFNSGFSKLLIIGGHGGNDMIIKITQSDWNYDHPNQKVHYLFAFTDSVKKAGIDHFGHMETHAGSVETSLIYAISPEYIKTNKTKIKNKAFLRKPFTSLFTHTSDQMSELGVITRSDTLTIDIKMGKQLLNLCVEDAVKEAKIIISNHIDTKLADKEYKNE